MPDCYLNSAKYAEQITNSAKYVEQIMNTCSEIDEIGDKLEKIISNLLSEKTVADKRWVDIGKAQLQQGLMALTRSVTKPEGF